MDRSDLAARLEALEAELARLRTITASEPPGIATDAETSAVEPAPVASRREMLRYGVAALGAVAAAGVVARPVEAANGDTVTVGASFTGTLATRILNSSTSGAAIIANSGSAIVPLSPTGLFGSAAAGSDERGVWGYATQSDGTGVAGQGNIGVLGLNSVGGGVGVLGQSFDGIPVRGEATGNSANTVAAVYGQNLSSYAGPGPGAGGFGVYGLSAKGHGLVGATAAAGGAAVVGATNGVAGALAGAFYGPVIVGGDFTVFGAKSAAVPHPDGSRRRLYCVESPESWFEDFGSGTLSCGCAEVAIDPDFAAVADMTDYHVFLTVYDQDQLLHVTNRTPAGFTVQVNMAVARLAGHTEEELTGRFGWRVVAKRKDIAGARLEPVTVPAEPTLPPITEVKVRAGDVIRVE